MYFNFYKGMKGRCFLDFQIKGNPLQEMHLKIFPIIKCTLTLK